MNLTTHMTKKASALSGVLAQQVRQRLRTQSKNNDASLFQQKLTPLVRQPPVVFITELNEFDVACGRGGGASNGTGNQRFLGKKEALQVVYKDKNTPTSLKTEMKLALFHFVKDFGGRFVEKCRLEGKLVYIEIDEKRALAKCSQALRDTNTCKQKRKARAAMMEFEKLLHYLDQMMEEGLLEHNLDAEI